MKSKKLLNDVMQELRLDEKKEINGGSAYSTARGLACFYQLAMGTKFSCSSDWFALNPGSGPSGSCVCTHR